MNILNYSPMYSEIQSNSNTKFQCDILGNFIEEFQNSLRSIKLRRAKKNFLTFEFSDVKTYYTMSAIKAVS